MKFVVCRSSLGVVSKQPPCPGAVRGPEASAWPGEFSWFIELATIEDLVKFLEAQGGVLGLYAPDEGEQHAEIEIFDDEEDEHCDGTTPCEH
jgi:hypothetical protein